MKPYCDDGKGIVIYNCDAREALSAIPDGAIDLILTDPPYSSGARRDADRQVRGSMLRGADDDEWFSHDAMTSWGFAWFLRSVVSACRPKLKPGSHLYVFSDWRQTPNVYGMLESCGYRVNQCLVWAKTHFGMGTYWRNQHEHIVFASLGAPSPMLDRGMGSVLTCPNVPPEQRVHPTEKPLALIDALMMAVPGSAVLDTFCGSGTTLVSAMRSRRCAIGVEVEERYCEIAARRLEQEVLDFGPPPPPQPEQESLL